MTELIGILNVTPDSFSDGGKYRGAEAAYNHARELIRDGAAIVDIGAESTRPGADRLTSDEEWARLRPVLERLSNDHMQLSIDSFHPETIERALALCPGSIVNDVTTFFEPSMREVVAMKGVPCILSHLPLAAHGDIQAAHQGTLVDSKQQVLDELMGVVALLTSAGVAPANIMLDPGIGFGKTPELNHELLRFAELAPNYRVVIGYSRKRFLGPERMSIDANLAAGRIAIASGAAYLRVHDVAAHAELLKELQAA